MAAQRSPGLCGDRFSVIVIVVVMIVVVRIVMPAPMMVALIVAHPKTARGRGPDAQNRREQQ